MTSRNSRIVLRIAPLILTSFIGSARATVFTGEVEAVDAQPVITPPSQSPPVVLRYFVPDGRSVRAGEPVLRIDAAQAESEVAKLRSELARDEATNDKAGADLELKRVDAELALVDAKAERDTAAIDAALPRKLFPAITYDRYQSEMKRAQSAVELKRQLLDAATAAVTQQRKDAELSAKRIKLQLDFNLMQVNQSTVLASRPGIIKHDFDNFFGAGKQYDEGSSSFPGQRVGLLVSDNSDFSVRAWMLESDRRAVNEGQPVSMTFDAIPGYTVIGHVVDVSAASTVKREWGDGRYVAFKIDLPKEQRANFLPGMSVRVDTDLQAGMAEAPAPRGQPIKARGEVYARDSVVISPPSVNGLWQLTIAQMADDGDFVKRGEVVVTFDASKVTADLTAKKKELAEKLRTADELRFEIDDKASDSQMMEAQADADLKKAARKSQVPAWSVAAIEYRKLVILREKAEVRDQLIRRREDVATRSRKAELHAMDLAVAQLQSDVCVLEKSLVDMTVVAPRDGLLLHQTAWSGDKIDTGSQVWRGQSVAQLPDLKSLIVRASLPERDLHSVTAGQRVQVTVSGGGDRRIDGVIESVGRYIHSESHVQPVPVVDLVVHVNGELTGLRPGQIVQVLVDKRPEGAR